MDFDVAQKQALFDAMFAMPTVDAHEHLNSEQMRLDRDIDIFMLFHQYLCVDLVLAGMPEADAEALGGAIGYAGDPVPVPAVPLDRKWEMLAPTSIWCATPR